MLKKDLPLGIIIYEGPSQIDGKPIIAVANGFKKTKNTKIGNMIQTWIIRSDIHPHDAIVTHEDFSICGDCKHRDFRSCYVNVSHGPIAVYNAHRRGSYKQASLTDLGLLKDRHIRLGSYGDPAAVPTYIWNSICKVVRGYTGYTHQWHKCDPELKHFCMASADSERERDLSIKKGWRTFRVRCYDYEPIDTNEFVCPASKEAGRISSCEKCGACSGVSNRKCPVITVHGWKHKIQYFRAGMKKIKNKKKYRIIVNPETVKI